MAYEFDTTVLGGLPVTVEYSTYYEDGECGYPGTCIDELSIVAVNGRTCKKAPEWIYKRMSKADHERLDEEAYQHAQDY